MAGLVPNKVVVPVDFSELSFGALEYAAKISGPETAIEVIHVLPPLSAMEPGNMYGTITDQTRIDEVKKGLREKMSDPKYDSATVHAVIGDAGREIAEFAQREGADLILIPSHGYGFLTHLLLGSVAERVVRLAHCPVLVLRS